MVSTVVLLNGSYREDAGSPRYHKYRDVDSLQGLFRVRLREYVPDWYGVTVATQTYKKLGHGYGRTRMGIG